MKEKFVIFDWKGFMAHFRQFDANSSSLSYSFPPPTVIMGMLAGIMGIERDDYYERFTPEQMQIAVQIVTVPRKIMQTINYIFAKSPGDLNMSSKDKHTQIPAELVVAHNFPNQYLHYRIFLKFQDMQLAREVKDPLINQRFKYLPFLGSANFNSWIDRAVEPENVEELQTAEPVVVETVVDLRNIELKSLSMDYIDNKPPAFFREHMRRAFKSGREPGEVIDVIWERNRSKIKAQFKQSVYKITALNQNFTVSFL